MTFRHSNPLRQPGGSSAGSEFSRSGESEAEPLLARLSAEQQQRLTELLDRYLRAQELGIPLDQQELVAAHPDLAETLQAYFCSLNELHGLAAGFGAQPLSGLPPADSFPAGGRQRLGDFELVREIGRGGMGVVYEARQVSLGRRVAVKVLPFAAILDARQIARFQHEAHAAAQLHHSHIVPVFAVGVERGVHYYAMQFIDGQPLDVAIAEMRGETRCPQRPGWRFESFENIDPEAELPDCGRSPFPPHRSTATRPNALLTTREPGDQRGFFRQVAQLGVQAAEALAAAHARGIVHRDIKPSNLLLETGGKLWVTDFGLARFQRGAALTRTGDLVGTLRYMSPEQAAGQAVDHRTDVYSLGATLYELACLRPLFAAQEGPALLAQITAAEPRPPRQVRPEMPVDLETVILKALTKERDGRYASAQHFADDLRCVAEGRSPSVRPPAWLLRAGTWLRRRQRAVAIAAGVLLLAAAGLWAGALVVVRERTKAATSVSRADRLASTAGAKNLALIRDVALSYDRLAAAHSALHEPAAARDCYERAIAMQQELLVRAPKDAAVQHDLAVSWNNLGLLECRAGRLAEAETALRRSLALQSELARRQPTDAALASDLGGTCTNLGIVLEKLGAKLLARNAFRDAASHQRRALELAPDTERFQALLGQHQGHLARVLRALEATGGGKVSHPQ